MRCKECEKAVYIYRELSANEKGKVDVHVQTCTACQQALTEMQQVNILIKKSSQALPRHSNPEWLTNKIMSAIADSHVQPKPIYWSFNTLFNVAFARYAMVAVSCCLVFMLLIELYNPSMEPNSMRGPVVSLQNVILNSKELRKNFSARKERKPSALSDCIGPFKKNIDVACLKEKLKKSNF